MGKMYFSKGWPEVFLNVHSSNSQREIELLMVCGKANSILILIRSHSGFGFPPTDKKHSIQYVNSVPRQISINLNWKVEKYAIFLSIAYNNLETSFSIWNYFQILRRRIGVRQVIWSLTFSKLFEIPLVPGQDIYKHSGNAKILSFFGLVRLL